VVSAFCDRLSGCLPQAYCFVSYSPAIPIVPACPCTVSFTNVSGITHSVEVSAESLMDAIALGLRDLRASGLTPVMPGPATSIRVAVKAAAVAEHSMTFRRFSGWLEASARSPRERLLEDRLRKRPTAAAERPFHRT
jgi:hypothetical protein